MLGKQDKGNKLLSWEELADQKSFYLLKLSPALIIGRQNFNCTVIPVIKSGFIPALVICSTLMITAVSVWYVIFVSFVPFLTLRYVLKTHFEPLKSSLSPADLYLWMNWNWSKCFYNSIFFLLAGHLGFFFHSADIMPCLGQISCYPNSLAHCFLLGYKSHSAGAASGVVWSSLNFPGCCSS